MRAASLLSTGLLLLSALASFPSVHAVGEPLGIRVMEDPSGDVAVDNPSGTPVPLSTDRNGFLDVLAVDVEEHQDGYFVHLWLRSLPPEPRILFAEEGYHRVGFHHGDVAFNVGMQFLQGEVAWLESDPGGTGQYDIIASLDLTVDAAGNRLTAFVPRSLLADRDGAPPFPGRSLTGFTASARGITANVGSINGQQLSAGVQARDDAAAPAGFALPVQFGAGQSGLARLASERPFRASNGEAATFIFQVEATSLAPGERTYRLAAEGVPAGWQVTFPQPQVRLNEDESTTLPVLALVPFAHQHGRLVAFRVELRDVADAGSVGRVELGLHYTDPAQPAGHHPDLYLHSRELHELETAFDVMLGGFSPATMNTAVEDPEDDGVDVTGMWRGVEVDGRTSWQWMVPLSPHLQMGLDVDLLRQGSLSMPFGTTLALPAARLEGALYVMTAEEGIDGFDVVGIPLATIAPTAEVDLLPTTPHMFEGAIVPLESGDYLPYDPEQNLVLILNLSAGRPSLISGAEAPVLKPGGHLTLPLLEYADPVDDVFATATGVDLDLAEGAERRAPPGGTALVTLRAAGPEGHYQLRALGDQASWAELPDGLHIGGDGTGEARLALHVPADARAGTAVDFILEASGGGEATRSLARLRLTVDPDAPDQGSLASVHGGKDAPGPGLALLFAAIVLAAVAGGRRRLL